VLGHWYWSKETTSVNTVTTPKVKAFYWIAIILSQTLGTALGDWMADTGGLGYKGGALVFAVGLAVTGGLYLWTNVSRVLLFWSAFILTRPLGATAGDFLDKPVSHDGPGVQLATRVGGDRSVHYRMPIRLAAAGGATSRRIPGGRR
jgi:uncharacterized membrane-anchored protein